MNLEEKLKYYRESEGGRMYLEERAKAAAEKQVPRQKDIIARNKRASAATESIEARRARLAARAKERDDRMQVWFRAQCALCTARFPLTCCPRRFSCAS